jgi:hypothetical protein
MNQQITPFNPNQTSVNPKYRKTVKHVLSIDSLYRKNYHATKSTDFIYTLPSPIQNVVSMKIAAVEYPNTWYMFSGENQSNVFTITLYNCPTPSDTGTPYPSVLKNVITIPEGNYLTNSFETTINNLFSNIRNGLEFICLEVNTKDGHLYFRTKHFGDDIKNIYLNSQINTNTNFYFTLDFTVESEPMRPLYRNAGWLMGFRQPFYTVAYQPNPTPIQYNNQFTTNIYNWRLGSESTYGGSVQNYIYLDVDDFNRNSVSNAFLCENAAGSYIGNNIMGRITVTSGMFTVITNTSMDLLFKTREYFGPIRLEKLHIRLLNKYGELVYFNWNDYSIMLELEVSYS